MEKIIQNIKSSIEYKKQEIIRFQENIRNSSDFIERTEDLIRKLFGEIDDEEFAITILENSKNVKCEDQETT